MIMIISYVPLIPKAYAHFGHAPHYNGGGVGMGRYYAYQALDPEYAKPNQPTAILFSVQDYSGNDVHNIRTMVEVYDANTGKRVMALPWTFQNTGDFQTYYTFPHKGDYGIVLSVANNAYSNNFGIDSPRDVSTRCII